VDGRAWMSPPPHLRPTKGAHRGACICFNTIRHRRTPCRTCSQAFASLTGARRSVRRIRTIPTAPSRRPSSLTPTCSTVNRRFPSAQLKAADVVSAFAGCVPGFACRGAENLLRRVRRRRYLSQPGRSLSPRQPTTTASSPRRWSIASPSVRAHGRRPCYRAVATAAAAPGGSTPRRARRGASATHRLPATSSITWRAATVGDSTRCSGSSQDRAHAPVIPAQPARAEEVGVAAVEGEPAMTLEAAPPYAAGPVRSATGGSAAATRSRPSRPGGRGSPDDARRRRLAYVEAVW
jgi:hypothetical protein